VIAITWKGKEFAREPPEMVSAPHPMRDAAERSGSRVMDSGGKTGGDANGARSQSARGSRQNADTSSLVPSGNTAGRILVVEDQDDVRRMVRTALEIEGYEVDEAASAPEGLRLLAEQEYDLVLSDYAMPSGTGAWMIEEAKRRGLMKRSQAIIITAHPDVRACAGVVVIYKPLDLDLFLQEVRTSVGQGQLAPPASSATPRRIGSS
jgi:CheY-like chemotaxis protein